MIIVRTHGGLGNQIFQIGQALMWQRRGGGSVTRLHDTRYKVVFPASPAFADLDGSPGRWRAAASWLRLPKLLGRAGFTSEQWRIGATRLLDGYFQSVGDWQRFPRADIAAVIADLRQRLAIVPGTGNAALAHLRLGDFFADEAAQRAHLAERLESIRPGTAIISNRDDLLTANAAMLAGRGLVHRPTSDLAPEAVLRLMAGFARIDSNDSTLAFWASVLGRAEMQFRHPRLAALHAALLEADA